MTSEALTKQTTFAVLAAITFTVAEKTLPDLAHWIESWLNGAPRDFSDAKPIAIGLAALLSIGVTAHAAKSSDDPMHDTISAVGITIILCLFSLVKTGVSSETDHPFANKDLIGPLAIWTVGALAFALPTAFASTSSRNILFSKYVLITLAGVIGLAVGLAHQWTLEFWFESQQHNCSKTASCQRPHHIVTPAAATALASAIGLLAHQTSNSAARPKWAGLLTIGILAPLAYGLIEGGDDWVGDLSLSRHHVALVAICLTLPGLLAAALTYHHRAGTMPHTTAIYLVLLPILAALAVHFLTLASPQASLEIELRRAGWVLSCLITPALTISNSLCALWLAQRINPSPPT